MRWLRELLSDVVIATGGAIVVFSLGLTLLILVTAVPIGNPYIGLFTFIILPGAVAAGLVLFIFGALLARTEGRFSIGPTLRRLRRAYMLGFFESRQRRRLAFFVVAGVTETVLLSIGGFRVARFMDTPRFCGQVCHQVMEPEFTAYQVSPHARVACVSCHIGSGESWLVRSKISGTRQVIAVLLNSYHRPIPTPVEHLRPARETCEVCHWPQKFSGDVVRTRSRFAEDEANTPAVSTIILKVGGAGPGRSSGIHWHVAALVWYMPLDEKRQEIPWVGVEGNERELTQYFEPNQRIEPQDIEKKKRLMDCVDCHNRATHIFRSPAALLDQALALGTIDPALPYIKREGLKALEPPSPSRAEAFNRVEALEGFYRASYPQVYDEKKEALARSLGELREMALLTTFPEMRVTWQTHPDNLGHSQWPGCFRCHGKLAEPASGKKISADCNLCHQFLPGR